MTRLQAWPRKRCPATQALVRADWQALEQLAGEETLVAPLRAGQTDTRGDGYSDTI